MGKRGGRRRNRANQWAEQQQQQQQQGTSDDDNDPKRQKVDDIVVVVDAGASVLQNTTEDQVQVTLFGVDASSLPVPFSLDDVDDDDENPLLNYYSKGVSSQIASIWKHLGHNNNKHSQWKPSKIQQHLWSILLPTRLGTEEDSSHHQHQHYQHHHHWSNTIGIAPTGSGKTLAYALPTVLSIMTTAASNDISIRPAAGAILVLLPTRELVQQVAKVFERVGEAVKAVASSTSTSTSTGTTSVLQVVSVHGGTPRWRQQQELQAAAKHKAKAGVVVVVVATPGRLLDWIHPPPNDKAIIDSKDEDYNFTTNTTNTTPRLGLIPVFQWIVLDEADQLTKDGDLGPQVDEILKAAKAAAKAAAAETAKPKFTPRLVLVSATYPETAKSRFESWVGAHYVLVQVGHHSCHPQPHPPIEWEEDDDHDRETKHTMDLGSLSRIPSHLEQILHVCSEHKKPRKLLHTLQELYKKFPNHRQRPLGIVFFSKIEKLKHISKLLEKEGIHGSIELHSQLDGGNHHNIRESHLAQFASGQKPLMLATDLAARGIDIPSVQFVIQYDFPGNLQQYVHRCGRAGRNYDSSKQQQFPKPTIFSFFTRNLKPMAPDLIRLLEANKAWVDPNLRALAQSSSDGILGQKTLKCSRKEKGGSSHLEEHNDDDDDDDDMDEFPDLSPNRIILKRASHVSDASSSSSSDGDHNDDGSR